MEAAGLHNRWEQLADGVYRCRLPFLDVSVGVVRGSNGALLVDCGTTLSEANQVAQDVCALTGSKPTHLVMTHHHFDHILGSGHFAGIESYAAPPVAEALTRGLPATVEHAVRYGADRGEVEQAARSARPPQHLVHQADIDLGERIVSVEHPGPGHTDHDLVVVVTAADPSRPTVVFCGDLVEQSADPSIDEESDLRQWPSTLDRLLALGGETGIYVPGHGAAVDAAFVRAQQDWLAHRPG